MATSQTSEILQHLRRAVLPQDGGGLTDEQLLLAYISRADEVALAALVGRHGPMVWGVCRRVLRDYHDAENAFQATFLVLVRRATSIASPALLANWLYGVAHHTALKARAVAAKRRGRERQVTEIPEPTVCESEHWDDLSALLDLELSRLPEKYRVAIVLCGLEGKTRKEAAHQLGVPEGTVAARLARGRTLLAKRLARQGLAVSSGSLIAELAQNAAPASAPTTLVFSTIRAAKLLAAGQAAATGVIPAEVADLTKGVLKAMFLTKIKIATTMLLAVVLLAGAGAGIAWRLTPGAIARVNPSTGERKEKPRADSERIQGKWEVKSAERMGKPFKEIVGNTITFDKTKYTIHHKKQDASDSGSFELDSGKKPKQINMTAEGLDRPTKGIYELDGDTLKLCIGDAPEDERPTKFGTKPEREKLVVLVMKRAKK